MRVIIVFAVGIVTICAGGCASDYSPRADLSSVQTIGLVVPGEITEQQGAAEVMQLYDRSVTEDRLKNSAAGAGSGAAVGTAAGVGAGAIIGCTAGGFLAPLCWTAVIVSGAVIGGGTGAIAGATVDTQQQVSAAPVHLYQVNKVLPDLQRDYLENTDLRDRALRLARQQFPKTHFITAMPDGDRYRLSVNETTPGPHSGVNLVLSEFRVQLTGKAENDPDLALSVISRWLLKKYDPSTNINDNWDIVEGSYQSEKHGLSEWLSHDGELLRSHVNDGIEASFQRAFMALAPETEEEQWARISPEESF